MKDVGIAVIGAGHSAQIAEMVIAQTNKKVLIVSSPFKPDPIPFNALCAPELKSFEPNNRRARRAKLRKRK